MSNFLFAEPGVSERLDNVPLQIREVAGDQVTARFGDDANLPDSCGQDARLGPFEHFRAALILEPDPVTQVGERRTTSGVGCFQVSGAERPALERKVGPGSADHALVDAFFDRQAAGGFRLIVTPELVQGFPDVGFPHGLWVGYAIDVRRHDRL